MVKKPKLNAVDLFSVSMTTGQLIKAWRKNFNIDQADMAYACDIPQASLSKIENDKLMIGRTLVLKLSAFMGINPLILFFPMGIESEPIFKQVQKRKAKMEIEV